MNYFNGAVRGGSVDILQGLFVENLVSFKYVFYLSEVIKDCNFSLYLFSGGNFSQELVTTFFSVTLSQMVNNLQVVCSRLRCCTGSSLIGLSTSPEAKKMKSKSKTGRKYSLIQLIFAKILSTNVSGWKSSRRELIIYSQVERQGSCSSGSTDLMGRTSTSSSRKFRIVDYQLKCQKFASVQLIYWQFYLKAMLNSNPTQTHFNGLDNSLLQSRPNNNFKQSCQNNWKLALIVIVILVVLGSMSNYTDIPLAIADEMTVVVIMSGRLDVVEESLRSIYKTTDFQHTKYLVVYDGNKSSDLDKVIENNQVFGSVHNSTTWIVTQGLIGEIACFDLAFSQVNTSYAFLSMGAWTYTDKNYIENAMKLMKTSRDISQVVVTEIDDIFLRDFSKISLYDTMMIGFNFLPSLFRMKTYHLLEGGLVGLTKNVTYGAGAGSTYGLISMYYTKKGYRVAVLNESYAKKIDKTNFSYKYLQYRDEYGYKGYWKVKPQQRDMCSVFLSVWGSFRIQSSQRRRAKRQISNIIALKHQDQRKDLQDYGLARSIQIGTQLDYINITSHQQYSNITELFSRTMNYHQKIYRQQKKKQSDIEILSPNNFNSYAKITQYLEAQQTAVPVQENKLSVKLAALAMQKSNDKKVQEAEYFYYANAYNIDEVKKQQRICVFVSGYKINQRGALSDLIQSINLQNYTNYQVVFATDENSDFAMERFYGLSLETNPRVLNRLKTSLKNEDVIGTPGNHYLRVNQFCRGTDIVVTLQGKSKLVGRQAFNVINTLFQRQQETWLAFFSPIEQVKDSFVMQTEIDVSQNFRKNAVETDKFLVAYRYELSTKLPIEYVMQFAGNKEDEYLRPAFFRAQTNAFHIYCMAEMSGSSRMKSFKAPLYFYNPLEGNATNQTCYSEKQAWMKTKALLKYPLHELSTISDSPQVNTNQKYIALALTKVKEAYSEYGACRNKKPEQLEKVTTAPFSEFLDLALGNMKVADYYISDFEVSKIYPMPFCFVIWAGDKISAQRSALIKESIENQHYENYTIIMVQKLGQPAVVKVSSEKSRFSWAQVYNVTIPSQSYLKYKKNLMEICTENSVVMFLNNPLKQGAIAELNNLHQRENSWMTYTVTDDYVQINSFYLRIYQLVYKNDFNQTNGLYLEEGDQQLQALAMLQLCPRRSSRYREEDIYRINDTTEGVDILYLRAHRQNSSNYTRFPYQYLLNLQQDFKTNLPLTQISRKKLQVGKQPEHRPFVNTGLNKIELLQAYQYQQIPYLPYNHMLNTREYQNLQRKFQISKYMSGDYKKKLVRFCVTIFGRNNTENDRYLKNLQMVILQNYSNFHIVFLDDDSDDQTLQLSMQYLNKQNFPKDRVTYVRNKERTFATYNIINSAFNFCDEDDVQVRLDGDDVIIGRNVFSLVNSFYQRNPDYYVVYTTFKSTIFTYGMGNQVDRIEQMILCNGGRRRFHFIAPLTTWRVKLIRSIPLKNHKLEYGEGWLYTLYDDALQFSFLDLATIDRIKFIPYFAYNYNTGYGSNDNSDTEKIKNRISLFEYVITLDKLKPMKDLNDERINNREVMDELDADRGVRWEVVDS